MESDILGRRLAVVVAVTAAMGMAMAWTPAGAQRVQLGDLRSRVPIHGDDEISRLATAFNNMAAALEQKEVVH
jgi:HAMP domain-containing protein